MSPVVQIKVIVSKMLVIIMGPWKLCNRNGNKKRKWKWTNIKIRRRKKVMSKKEVERNIMRIKIRINNNMKRRM